ncbi:Retrovirus-related Pol poly from transposon, partial [Paramuricea clavata]
MVEEQAEPQPLQQPAVQIMQSVTITPMPEFCPDAKIGTSLSTRWNNWQSDFEMYITASGITNPKRKRALLLYQAGPRVREIFKQIPETGTDTDYDITKQKLKAYFDPQKNRRYEVYRFRQTTQEHNETLDQFHTRLRTISETCEFADVEFEIEEQIIIGGNSSKIRKRALRDPTFDLKSMLLEERRDEQSKYQAEQIESKEQADGEANKLEQKPNNGNISNRSNVICRNCGRAYPHTGACPAKGKTCNNCGKPNHFAAVCRGKQKQTRSPRYSNKKHAQRNLKTLDTGSNTSSDEDYLYTATFYVAKAANCGNLLSLSTAQELGLISLHLDKLTSKNAALENILQKHSKVFSDLGKLKGEKIKLDIDKTKIPKAQPQRRIPYHIREKVKNAVTELENQDVIEKVPENEATPWVSPIVAVPKKDGQVRICVDMRLANEAIRR